MRRRRYRLNYWLQSSSCVEPRTVSPARAAFNEGLACFGSEFQSALEITLSGDPAKVQRRRAFQLGPKMY